MGTKRAKKLKEETISAKKLHLDKENSKDERMSATVERIECILTESVREKAKVAKEKIELQRERLDMEMAGKLMTATSGVTEMEKDEIQRLIKSRLVKRLGQKDSAAAHPTKNIQQNGEDESVNLIENAVKGENQTAHALFTLSNVDQNGN
ncbi:unnamed protein product [Agarophyton chilense]